MSTFVRFQTKSGNVIVANKDKLVAVNLNLGYVFLEGDNVPFEVTNATCRRLVETLATTVIDLM